MDIAVLSAWEDNYIFIMHKGENAIIIDPTDASVCDQFLTEKNVKPQAILITHHHPDHISGIDALVKKYEIPVYCSEYDKDRVPHSSRLIQPGDQIQLLGTEFEIIDLRGHTLGLIGYYNQEKQALFCGDCLFSLGCGYLFEGSAKQMQESLNRIKLLPEDTKIYCSHEYTLANARFQRSLEIREEFVNIETELIQKRSKGEFTIPTSLAFEKEWNLFLRWDDEQLKQSLGLESLTAPEYFAEMRNRKNKFK